ncbi:uncharacterized protein LY89DRAFT_681722 [Mollisia scopiformis]|uniref:Uncharacterized protein n=1 Tax=Mollisia scopiformis TaxID=149040 RepID=A0A194XLI9_MOLSC|nr:uncharacterized protein LY89DRAFT_681722 [Mollisia scopiformis]KUJ21110.1 hypothetical protein LY89DRAFT_681722 [Mollisia scopiformis]
MSLLVKLDNFLMSVYYEDYQPCDTACQTLPSRPSGLMMSLSLWGGVIFICVSFKFANDQFVYWETHNRLLFALRSIPNDERSAAIDDLCQGLDSREKFAYCMWAEDYSLTQFELSIKKRYYHHMKDGIQRRHTLQDDEKTLLFGSSKSNGLEVARGDYLV